MAEFCLSQLVELLKKGGAVGWVLEEGVKYPMQSFRQLWAMVSSLSIHETKFAQNPCTQANLESSACSYTGSA